MARTALGQWLTGLWMATAAASDAGAWPRAAQMDHVRCDSAALTGLIQQATEGSATFRRIVDEINASDGIVYVQEGTCPDNANACFVGVTAAGPRRMLWVRVSLNPGRAVWEVIGSIGHELRHTLEVLGVRWIRSTAEMQLFYLSAGFQTSTRSYETSAALHAGAAIRNEIRASTRPRYSK